MTTYDQFASDWKANPNRGSDYDNEYNVYTKWGLDDPLQEMRRRYGAAIPASVSDAQFEAALRRDPSLLNPKSGGGIGEFLKPLAFIAGSALGGPVGGSIAAANGSGASSDMGVPAWAQAAGQIAGTAYGGGTNTGGTASGTPQGFGDGGAGVGSSSAAAAQSGNPFAPGSFWDRSTAMNTIGNTVSDASSDIYPAQANYAASQAPGDVWGSNMAGGGEVGSGYAASAAGGGGILDWLHNTITSAKGAAGNLGPLGQAGVGAGANFLINQYMKNQAQGQAKQTQQAGNPLNDPQRQTFQQQSADLVNNPQNYFKNNPFATALTNQYRNNVIPTQVAKSGNPSQVIDNAGSAFATALGGNYNQLLNTLQGYGGFNQGNSGVAPSVNLQTQGNAFGAESFRGAGNVVSQAVSSIFGDPTKPNQGGAATAFGTTKLGA